MSTGKKYSKSEKLAIIKSNQMENSGLYQKKPKSYGYKVIRELAPHSTKIVE
ncbi:MAG: hypothetical protein ACI9DJ_001553 [Algoriphagus sp.]|jgi:hypothetical protein